ncbi:cadherin repeat domain-containing protein [Aurantiacibacter aquimixticola]|uniref:cadherin repeat domain-containing protein n=1 Tax=Aurantiacibacter aquimixticola TaxID=1958945 RepID=UPI0014034377|nr:cadherin repeat domain-containing protein [Aurantiacibacter aquimixticola]
MAGAALLLAGCGGGSSGNGGGGGGGGTANLPPRFTNSNAISFVESQTFTDDRAVVQLAATDPDSSSLVFSFVQGKDAALFSFVNGPGRIAFNQAPSFETPRDADGDNVYEIDVSVSDGVNTTRQTIRITVTNSLEGLLFSEVATGLGQNGKIAFLEDTKDILVVDQAGNMARVDATTGAITRAPRRIAFGAGTIIGTATESLNQRGGKFYALASDGTHVRLLDVQYDTGAAELIWEYRSPAPIEASLGLLGDDPVVALGDAGSPTAAQDPDDPRGNVIGFVFTSDTATPTVAVRTPISRGWGLHNPIFALSGFAGDILIDRGERSNEANAARFNLGQANANFEWPIRDGETDVGFSGTVVGERVPPRLVQEIGANNAGLWLDAGDSLQGDSWRGVWIISDANGNIWTWDSVNSGPLERRNVDFGITNPTSARAFVSIDNGDRASENVFHVFLLRADGRLFRADTQR